MKDYFRLFRMERTFEVDTAELSRRFREMQARLHPDKFVGAGKPQVF